METWQEKYSVQLALVVLHGRIFLYNDSWEKQNLDVAKKGASQNIQIPGSISKNTGKH